MEWNNARWETANALVNQGIPAGNIDGGHEFNGWNGALIDKYGKWDTQNFEYILSFSEMEGYQIIDRKETYDYVTWKEYPLYVLKRVP
jgi:hypothetical protein